MRISVLLVAMVVFSTPAIAQRQVPVRLVHVTTENTDDPDAELRTNAMSRAWFDSVSSYFSAELRARGPRNVVRVHEPRLEGYQIRVMGLPIMFESGQPSGAVAYSAIIFRPPAIGNNWQYVSSFIGYSSEPRGIARTIVNFFNNAVAVRD